MASINFNNLAKDKTKSRIDQIVKYTYTDLYLDLQNDRVNNIVKGDINRQRDVRVAYDEMAIKNSLINLFNTRPGQRILLPLYGTNLQGYIFEQITKIAAKVLGLELQRAIERWEPRVQVSRIVVKADSDNLCYRLLIELSIPVLSQKQISFTGIISDRGFVETNRRNHN